MASLIDASGVGEAAAEGIKFIHGIVDKIFPDPAEAAKAKLALAQLDQQGALEEFKARISVLVAEAQSNSWLANSWRPITMLSFVSIIVNNYLLFPWLTVLGVHGAQVEIPVNVWDIINGGLQGYVMCRTGEKVAPHVAEVAKAIGSAVAAVKK